MSTTIVGIAGPSCSGKTTVSEALSRILQARIFRYDDYLDRNARRVIVNGHESIDRPDQYRADVMADDIARHLVLFPGVPVVAEGFLLFCHNELNRLFHARIFVDIEEKTITARRRARAMGRGYCTAVGREADIERAFLANGLEEWRRFGAPQASMEGVRIVSGENSREAVIRDALLSLRGHPAVSGIDTTIFPPMPELPAVYEHPVASTTGGAVL